MTQVSIVKELEEKASIGRTTAKNTIRDIKRAMGITATKYPDEVRAKILHFAVSGETPVPMPVNADSSFDEIRDAGYLHLNDTEANAVAFAHDVAALKEKCTKGQGGSDFGKRANDYWGLSSSQASRLLKVGQNTNFPEFGKVLPKSISALEPLAALTHGELESAVVSGDVTPTTTAREAKQVVNDIKKPPPPKEQPIDDVDTTPVNGEEYHINSGGEAVPTDADGGDKIPAHLRDELIKQVRVVAATAEGFAFNAQNNLDLLTDMVAVVNDRLKAVYDDYSIDLSELASSDNPSLDIDFDVYEGDTLKALEELK